MRKFKLLPILPVFFLGACQSYFGPTTLNTTHPAYNQAIVNSLDQQMLLNLVRLKYRDQPYFLKVGRSHLIQLDYVHSARRLLFYFE